MAVIATGNREDALDIVQDAMLKLVRTYANKPANSWPPLFYRILQSTIRDWYRRNRIRNALRDFFSRDDRDDSSDDMDSFEHKTSLKPDDKLKQSQTMDALDSALHDLPLRQQQAFLLRKWHGFDVRETAEIMRCSEGSVKTHLSRATEVLKYKLEDYHD